MTTVPASVPELLWAAPHARLYDVGLVMRFNKWPLRLSGEAQSTLKYLEDFARPGGRFMTPDKMFRIDEARFMLGTHT